MTETKVSSAGCCDFLLRVARARRDTKREESRRVENATGKRIYIAKRRSKMSHVSGDSGNLDDLPEEEEKRVQGQVIVRQGCSSDHKKKSVCLRLSIWKEEQEKQDQPLLQALWLERVIEKNKRKMTTLIREGPADQGGTDRRSRRRDALLCNR